MNDEQRELKRRVYGYLQKIGAERMTHIPTPPEPMQPINIGGKYYDYWAKNLKSFTDEQIDDWIEGNKWDFERICQEIDQIFSMV